MCNCAIRIGKISRNINTIRTAKIRRIELEETMANENENVEAKYEGTASTSSSILNHARDIADEAEHFLANSG